MYIKEGIIPTVLGSVVAITGYALKKSDVPDSYRNGLIGFGLANIAIGSTQMITSNFAGGNMIRKVSKAMQMK